MSTTSIETWDDITADMTPFPVVVRTARRPQRRPKHLSGHPELSRRDQAALVGLLTGLIQKSRGAARLEWTELLQRIRGIDSRDG